jgi:lipopolysaccharide/colanic/teichoic acid biosynthesis glycosyltransferase
MGASHFGDMDRTTTTAVVLTGGSTLSGAAKFTFRRKPVYEALSRAINIAVAGIGLLCLSPLIVLLAIAIKLSDLHAPILYRGARVGRGKRIFQILKFRTMAVGTEAEVGANLVTRDSAQITRIGRMLRRRKLDELPQLINILRGDMNLVGPRPVRPVFLQEFEQRIDGYAQRFLVAPGLTGLAQTRGGYYTDARNKYRYERLYLQSRSLLLDFKLMTATGLILGSRVLSATLLMLVLVATAFYALSFALPVWRLRLGHITLNLTPLLIAVVTSVIGVRALHRRRYALRKTPADAYIIYFVCWGILGAVTDANPLHSLGRLLYFTGVPFLAYFAAVQLVGPDLNRTLRQIRFLAALAVVVALSGIGALLAVRLVVLNGGTVMSHVPNIMFKLSGLYFPLMAPLALYLTLYSEKMRQRRIWRLGTCLVVACVLITDSRTGEIALFAALLTFLWRAHRTAFVGALLASAAFLVPLLIHDVREWQGLGTSGYSSIPFHIQDSTQADRRDFDLLGSSWSESGADQSERTDLDGNAQDSPSWIWLGNSYVILVRQRGIIGLFFALLIIIMVLGTIRRAAYDRHDSSLEMLLWAFFCGAVGFLTGMLFSNCFDVIVVYLLFWLMVGLGTGVSLVRGPALQFYRLDSFSD